MIIRFKLLLNIYKKFSAINMYMQKIYISTGTCIHVFVVGIGNIYINLRFTCMQFTRVCSMQLYKIFKTPQGKTIIDTMEAFRLHYLLKSI